MISQIESSDQWAFYQAKSIKSSILELKKDMREQFGKKVSEKDLQKASEYDLEKEKIKELAEEKQHESRQHLKIHEKLARSVTFFQVSIALAAIAVLIRRRRMWFVSMGFACVGVVLFVIGFI
jgi:lipopolysaccharide export LptBFGC system permease protein LptF